MKKEIPFKFQSQADLTSLYEIIKTLRGEGGCPWDRKQTPETLKKYLIEEAYEVYEAITTGSEEEIQEELGDLLFLLLFIIFLYEEKGAFSLKDLVYLTFQKMIRRHPHVFGEDEAKSAEEVLSKWQKIKEKEGKSDSVLGNIPKSLPALQRAYRIGERAGRVGFDWKTPEEIFPKLEEEIKELKEALLKGEKERVSEELGDLLFTLANLSRKLGINPEEALKFTLDKFERRFKEMEKIIKGQGLSFEKLSLEEMDRIWDEVKEKEK
ncbi:MAG: nucleoside triphosphate pyrophosphohydrolase [Caldimicrobium thiodismutans]|uniref:Nucleoside triphosphate pyrophosphohydrolase n=1 Tax=Caldimicrobium thiodismutans TaxID=1653476 RepID=A0A2N7PLK5_9BACT|nr:MAG: nucleoside triphosphate pyrophosphohydrolase [Caldimicrobium thiodismutans]